MEKIKEIIESLLFVAETALTIERIKQVVAADTQEIRAALDALTQEYESRQGGFYLNEVAGGYQIRTRPEYTEWIKRLIQPNPPRMSKAALETLAIIAYKQPIIRSDIEHIRGVDSGGVLRLLLERKLIRVLGRKEIPGRPLIYATTKQFLEVFDLKDLRDLPTPKEIESFGRSLLEESPPADSAEAGQSLEDKLLKGEAVVTERHFDDEDALENFAEPEGTAVDETHPEESADPEQAFEEEAFFEDSAQREPTIADEAPPEQSTETENDRDNDNPRENT